jgi:hypothetical protein
LLLATLREPPQPGSLRESILLMLIIHKDRIEHAATRLLTQAQINPQAAPKEFEEYVKVRYPYLETAKKREHDESIKMLLDEVKRGPIVIRPMGNANISSKLYKRIKKHDEASARAVTSRLSKKMGGAVPI